MGGREPKMIEKNLYDLSKLRQELKMWEEYKSVIHQKSLEKGRTDNTAQEFVRSEEKVDKLIGKIQKVINQCLDIISTIDDSTIRQACYYKWVENKSWVQIGFKLNTSDEAIRVRVRRYLKKTGII